MRVELANLTAQSTEVHELFNGQIRRVRNAVRNYINSDLTSDAFASHKAYMDEGHLNGALENIDRLLRSIIASNWCHINAIDTHLTDDYYCRICLIETIACYDRQINNTNPRNFGQRVFLPWNWFSTDPYEATISALRTARSRHQEKLRRLDAYLRDTSTVNASTETLVERVKRDLVRLEMTTRHVTARGVTVNLPAWSQVDAAVEGQQELRMLMRRLMPNDVVKWDVVGELLARPYNEITPMEYLALAQVFTRLDASSDQEPNDLTRFVQMMASQLDDEYVRGSFLFFTTGRNRRSAWEFCSNKIAGIQSGIDAMMGETTILWMMAENDNEKDNFVARHQEFFQRFSLLSVIDTLGDYRRVVPDRTSNVNVLHGPLTGETGASAPLLNIALDNRGGLDLVFHKNMNIAGMGFDTNHPISESSLNIGRGRSGDELQENLRNTLRDNLLYEFSFCMNRHIRDGIIKEITNSLLGELQELPGMSGLGTVISLANFAKHLQDGMDATRRYEMVVNGFNKLDLGHFTTRYNMSAVIVTDHAGEVHDIFVESSPATQVSLTNINRRLIANFENPTENTPEILEILERLFPNQNVSPANIPEITANHFANATDVSRLYYLVQWRVAQ